MSDPTPLGPDDVGTRRQHMAELHQLWTDGLGMTLFLQNAYENEEAQERQKKLEIAIELLETTLFQNSEILSCIKEINSLPNVKDIT